MGICGQERVDRSREKSPHPPHPGASHGRQTGHLDHRLCVPVHLSLPGLIIKAAPFFVTHMPAGQRGGFPAKSFTLVDKPVLPLKADGSLSGETQPPVLPSSGVRVQPHSCPS